MENEVWNRYTMTRDCAFFPIFARVIKQVEFGKESIMVRVVHKERTEKIKKPCHDLFKLVFEWQDENVCGIDVFKKVWEE